MVSYQINILHEKRFYISMQPVKIHNGLTH